jgi:hypothetical protein
MVISKDIGARSGAGTYGLFSSSQAWQAAAEEGRLKEKDSM